MKKQNQNRKRVEIISSNILNTIKEDIVDNIQFSHGKNIIIAQMILSLEKRALTTKTFFRKLKKVRKK